MDKKTLLFSVLLLLAVAYVSAGEKEDAWEKFTMNMNRAPFRERKQGSCRSAEKRSCGDDEICDPLYTSQWHLNRDFLNFTGPTKGVDMGVQGAWAEGFKGKGVLINFVDDGVEIGHPDLTGCTRSVSYDFENGGSDPSKDADHGTSCAGVAVARKNDACGVGVAYEASYGGVRLLGAGLTAADEAVALTYGLSQVDIYSNSWGPQDDGLTLAPLSQVVSDALEQGVNEGRGGKGSIYMWAAGNGGSAGDSCSYDGYVESQFTIPIGAVDEYGKKSYYSESCAALLGVATSSGDTLGIVTTDRQPPNGFIPGSECTYEFSGTSAATPMGAGVVALCLQANPDLTWRDVQSVLIHSSVKNDREDPGWEENGAGLLFNPKYGYGLLNATRAVQLALEWQGIGEYSSFKSSKVSFNQGVINRNPDGFEHEFLLGSDDISSDSSKVEHVILTVDVSHRARNNLTITLTSPSGTVSTLASSHLQGQIPTFVLHLSSDAEIAGAGMGFGTVYDEAVEGTLIFADCSVPTQSYEGFTVLALMNQEECTPYEQFMNLQEAGANSVVFVPDYPGDFREFGDSDDSNDVDVDIPVMQIPRSVGNLIVNNADVFKGVGTMVTAVEHLQRDYKNYPFSSLQFWGESGEGTWKVEITDEKEGDSLGTVQSLQLTVYGEGFAVPYKYGGKSSLSDFQIVLIVVACLLALLVVGLVAYASQRMASPRMESVPTEDPFGERLE